MTLYYSLTFALLMVEMTLFLSLIVPMPHAIKRKLFTFISESPLVAKAQYWMKIIFVFILILFVDSVNRVYRVQLEVSAMSGTNANGAATTVISGADRSDAQARKFYSQRNMYLCGFTLFLSLILNRTYIMILEQLRLEEKVLRLEGKGNPVEGKKLDDAGRGGEIGSLKNKLAQKDRDLETMKKQVRQLQEEYGAMGDRVTHPDPTPKKDR